MKSMCHDWRRNSPSVADLSPTSPCIRMIVADRGVLDLRELLGRDLACGELVAGLEHLLGAQQAADVIGAEGRTGVVCHAAGSFWCSAMSLRTRVMFREVSANRRQL